MKNTLLKLLPLLSLAVVYPILALADTVLVTDPCAADFGFIHILCRLQILINYVVPVLVALGVLYFVWGVVQYVIGDSEEAKKKGRDHIVAGIIGLAVIISLWGLVYIVVNTFGTDAPGPTNSDLYNLLPHN